MSANHKDLKPVPVNSQVDINLIEQERFHAIDRAKHNNQNPFP